MAPTDEIQHPAEDHRQHHSAQRDRSRNGSPGSHQGEEVNDTVNNTLHLTTSRITHFHVHAFEIYSETPLERVLDVARISVE